MERPGGKARRDGRINRAPALRGREAEEGRKRGGINQGGIRIMYEGIFAAFCLGFSATMLWCAAGLAQEPFWACVAVFMAGFFGSLAGFLVWGRIEGMRPQNRFRSTVIMPRPRP